MVGQFQGLEGCKTRPVSDIGMVYLKQVEYQDRETGEKLISHSVILLMKNGKKESLIGGLSLDGAIQLTERLERFLNIEVA